MGRLLFTRRAREDLLDIWVYVASHTSEMVADRVCEQIERACQSLKQFPQLGRARPEIHADARGLVVERWLALYRVVEDGVQVTRIVDAARDLAKIEWAVE